MPTPLRRLSVALKMNKSYRPHTIPDVSTLAQFLTLSKEKYLSDILRTPGKAGEWTVVMGNEAADLDTLASSIAFAWIQSEVHKKPTIPLIQIERDDFNLRAENIHALNLAGLHDPKEQLLTFSDLPTTIPFPSHKFALVDHNSLGTSFTLNNPTAQVVAVVDHHEDEGLYTDTANPRTVVRAGSCSSHIASLCPSEVPAELATLLLCAILIDTSGLKPSGKALQVDLNAASFLAPRSTFAPSLPLKLVSSLADDKKAKTIAIYEAQAIKDLTRELSLKKFDLSHFDGSDLLRRDYKEYNYTISWAADEPSIKAGLSTVPIRLEEWATDGKLEKAALPWMKRRGIAILGVLTSFRDGGKSGKNSKGKHMREMAWIVCEDIAQTSGGSVSSQTLDYQELSTRLWEGLESSDEIKVKKHKRFDLEKGGTFPEGIRTRVYKQRNADATRKVTAPLLKKILENSTNSSPTPKPQKK